MRVSGCWHTECFLYLQTAKAIFATERAGTSPVWAKRLLRAHGCYWSDSGFRTCSSLEGSWRMAAIFHLCSRQMRCTHVLKSGPERSEEACFLKKRHQLWVSRDVAVTASLRSHEIKQAFAEDRVPHARQKASRSAAVTPRPPDDAHLSRRDPGGELPVTWRMKASRLREGKEQLPAAPGARVEPRGGRLWSPLTRARSQMVPPSWTAWIALGQCCTSSRLTATATALMTNSGSHMLLITPSLAFWCGASQTRALLWDHLFVKYLSDSV